jgi:diguanylate cyclase (GGDEF)-like protein
MDRGIIGNAAAHRPQSGVFSISHILCGTIGLMALALIAQMGIAVLSAIERSNAAQRVATISLIDKALFQAVQHFRFERGTMQVILVLPANQTVAEAQFVLLNRRGVDAGLAEALAGLDALAIIQLPDAVAALKTDYQTYQALRGQVDREARLPPEARDQRFRDDFLPLTSRLQTSIERVSSILESEMRRLDPAIADLLVTKSLAWIARSALGANMLSFNSALVGQRDFTPDEVATIRTNEGRIGDAWRLAQRIVEAPQAAPELSAAFDVAQRAAFSGPFVDLYTQVLGNLANHRAPGVTLSGWRANSVAPQQAVSEVSLVAMDLITRHANTVALQARMAAIGFGAILIMAIVLGGGGLLVVLLRVSRPIVAMTRAMQQLAEDDPQIRIPGAGRRDEIGGMAAAVEVFKDNILRLREAKSEIERTNLMLDAAVSHIVQGLCLFAPDNTLQVVNRRFCEILHFPADAVRPGMLFRDIVEHVARSGLILDVTVEEHVARVLKGIATRQTLHSELHFEDGRAVTINHCQLPNRGWVATLEDITERRQQEQQVVYMARHDALSGLPNRMRFQERMAEAISCLGRGQQFALHYLDLDRFKEVNDSLGHAIGDGLLKVVAGRLRDCVRKTDTVARLGGDEFAVLQLAINQPQDAAELADRLIQLITQPCEIDGHSIAVGTSVGIALAPQDGADPSNLLKHADMALYRAKADGRGTFRYFEQDMDSRLLARREVETDLRGALEADQLEVFYQPMLSTMQGRITGFEALLRWRHPTRGIVSPADFIPLAEDTGLIVSIGEWVLRRACDEAAGWPQDIKVAVNLSPVQFRKGRLVEVVTNVLAASGLAPQRLELEITEAALLQGNEETLVALRQLRDMGVRIAMDDFGTGYSSLSYLRQFPFDKIKIDRSFVQDLERMQEASTITRAITSLGSGLGIATTAEGVETAAQLAELRLEGCTEVQGFLFSPPRPGGEIPRMLAQFNGVLTPEEVIA